MSQPDPRPYDPDQPYPSTPTPPSSQPMPAYDVDHRYSTAGGTPQGAQQPSAGDDPYAQPAAGLQAYPGQAPGQAYPAQPYPGEQHTQPYPAQQYPAQQYAAQPYAAPYAGAGTSTMAIIALVAGILGLSLLPFLGSIAAVIIGPMARREIDRTGQEGRPLATIGIVLGWIGLGLALLGILAAVAIPVFLSARGVTG